MDEAPHDQAPDADRLIDELIEREGGFVNHPADRGGATRFGITEAVARAHGYSGAMAMLPRDEASAIYGFHLADRLLATEQAIQLDELIKWVNGQAAVGGGEPRSGSAPAPSTRGPGER